MDIREIGGSFVAKLGNDDTILLQVLVEELQTLLRGNVLEDDLLGEMTGETCHDCGPCGLRPCILFLNLV